MPKVPDLNLPKTPIWNRTIICGPTEKNYHGTRDTPKYEDSVTPDCGPVIVHKLADHATLPNEPSSVN